MTAFEISKIGIGAIVKENFTTLLEWIAFHRVIGVEHFWIADNGSGTATRQLLQDLDRLGIIHYIPFPSKPGESPQLPAYKKILAVARDFDGVLAFIDADEFLVPQGASLRPFVEKVFKDQGVSALALNWAKFGSNGALFAEDGLVIERFTRRARRDVGNKHFKSIVRPERVKEFLNSHLAKLHHGRYVNAAGRDLVLHSDSNPGMSADVSWNGARINHYIIKSLEEFLLEKHLRGDVADENRVIHRHYFIRNDHNDEECLLAARFAPQVHAEIARLTALCDQLQSCLHSDQLRLYQNFKNAASLQWNYISQPSAKPYEPPDYARTALLRQEILKQRKLLEDLSVFNRRLFRSWQYRIGSTIGSLIRTFLLRAEKRSLPEIKIRQALEQYDVLRKVS